MNIDTKSATFCIKQALPKLSKTESQIADFILANPKTAINPSIEELAELIGCSVATLVRFVRKIGFGGYQQFRISLATETLSPQNQVFEVAINKEDDIVTTVFKSAEKALNETYNTIDRTTIKRAVKELIKAPRCYLFGLGGSNILALDFYHKIIRTGLNCQYTEDFHMQLMVASQAKEGDIAVLFSHTGANYDILCLAEELKANSCKIIAITSFSKSQLAKMSDYVITSYHNVENLVSESFSSRIATSAITDVFYVYILEELKNDGIVQLNKMRNIIAKRRL